MGLNGTQQLQWTVKWKVYNLNEKNIYKDIKS